MSSLSGLGGLGGLDGLDTPNSSDTSGPFVLGGVVKWVGVVGVAFATICWFCVQAWPKIRQELDRREDRELELRVKIAEELRKCQEDQTIKIEETKWKKTVKREWKREEHKRKKEDRERGGGDAAGGVSGGPPRGAAGVDGPPRVSRGAARGAPGAVVTLAPIREEVPEGQELRRRRSTATST